MLVKGNVHLKSQDINLSIVFEITCLKSQPYLTGGNGLKNILTKSVEPLNVKNHYSAKFYHLDFCLLMAALALKCITPIKRMLINTVVPRSCSCATDAFGIRSMCFCNGWKSGLRQRFNQHTNTLRNFALRLHLYNMQAHGTNMNLTYSKTQKSAYWKKTSYVKTNFNNALDEKPSEILATTGLVFK